MYYALILLSVSMFGGGFALNDLYRKMRGSGLKISLESSFIGALAGLTVLVAVNGFQLEFTWFTLCIAFLNAVNGIAFIFCAFKALDSINLSLFSLFSMLGGMLLPFLQGIVFFNEKLTVAKIVCILFIVAALSLTISRDNKKKGAIFYIGIFVLNGMSGVLAKIFASAAFPKTSAAMFSIWSSVCTLILAGTALLFLLRKRNDSTHCSLGSVSVAAVGGINSQIANFILVLSLAHVDASVQYPMVTGGVMIVSTLISLFGNKKPGKKEICAVGLAFVAMLALFFIPI